MQDVMEYTDFSLEKIPTGIEGSTDADNIMITQSAIDMIGNVRIENNISDDHFLRIATRSGGCSGMSYSLGFDNEIAESDRKLDTGKINIVVDSKSLFYLMGVTLDYVEGPHGSGFVFNNPNDSPTCGCHG